MPIGRCGGDSAPGSAAAPDGQPSDQAGLGWGRSRPGADAAGCVAWAVRVLEACSGRFLSPRPRCGFDSQLEDGTGATREGRARLLRQGEQRPQSPLVSSVSPFSLFALEPTGSQMKFEFAFSAIFTFFSFALNPVRRPLLPAPHSPPTCPPSVQPQCPVFLDLSFSC